MPAPTATRKKRIRATVRIPRALYDEVRGVVRQRQTTADNINDFVVNALRAYVKLLERHRIDAEFAAMAIDAEYQKEAAAIAEEFSASDWEAFELGQASPKEA